MAPLLMLLLALLASGAHAQFNLEIHNDLSDSFRANDAECTVSAPQLGGTGEASVFVPAQSTRTLPLLVTQSLSSPTFKVEVFGSGPLGMGCRGCCFFGFIGCSGKTYTTRGDVIQRITSLLGYKIVLVGNCGTQNQPQLLLKGYTTVAGQADVEVASTCVPHD